MITIEKLKTTYFLDYCINIYQIIYYVYLATKYTISL